MFNNLTKYASELSPGFAILEIPPLKVVEAHHADDAQNIEQVVLTHT